MEVVLDTKWARRSEFLNQRIMNLSDYRGNKQNACNIEKN
jgi:hypothetical protein